MEDSQPSLVHAGNSTTRRTIPFDLIIEILSLLPGKSLFRFQSVSKQWFSTIRSKFFVDLFQTRSKSRPRLLLTLYLRDAEEQFIFSAPEHTDDDKSSSSVMARYDMPISAPGYNLTSGSVNGFVCFRGVSCHTIAVYNPTTRQIVKLPDVTPNGRYMYACLGYDPVEDQYKVLCVMMFGSERQDMQPEHFVCTVSSSQKQEWRKIENPTGVDYRCIFGDKCIDGALYYEVGRQSRIVSVDYSCTENLMTLWVLEDVEKQEWSSMMFVLPSKWEDLPETDVVSKGLIHTGELMVFIPWSKRFGTIFVSVSLENSDFIVVSPPG
uniref:F-box domain-containing protein n=1 Tax=Brassica oleracea var. oleracea TaxID=109376 RepID=A0A0D3B283_BRAOL